MPPRCTPAPMLPRRKVLATALLLAASPVLPALAPPAADATAVDLDTAVVTAGGSDPTSTDPPASTSVLTREELAPQQAGHLAGAPGEVEGVDIGQGTGKPGGRDISIRGMPSAYTLVLIDGRRQNNGGDITPNGFGETANGFMPPLSAIERIEVIRGPMSTLYGSDAVGGVASIITRSVPDPATASAGPHHTFQ